MAHKKEIELRQGKKQQKADFFHPLKDLSGRYSGATPRINFVSSCFHKSTAQSTTTSYVPIYLIDAS